MTKDQIKRLSKALIGPWVDEVDDDTAKLLAEWIEDWLETDTKRNKACNPTKKRSK